MTMSYVASRPEEQDIRDMYDHFLDKVKRLKGLVNEPNRESYTTREYLAGYEFGKNVGTINGLAFAMGDIQKDFMDIKDDPKWKKAKEKEEKRLPPVVEGPPAKPKSVKKKKK